MRKEVGLKLKNISLLKQIVYNILQQIHAEERKMLTNHGCYTKKKKWQLLLYT